MKYVQNIKVGTSGNSQNQQTRLALYAATFLVPLAPSAIRHQLRSLTPTSAFWSSWGWQFSWQRHELSRKWRSCGAPLLAGRESNRSPEVDAYQVDGKTCMSSRRCSFALRLYISTWRGMFRRKRQKCSSWCSPRDDKNLLLSLAGSRTCRKSALVTSGADRTAYKYR